MSRGLDLSDTVHTKLSANDAKLLWKSFKTEIGSI